MQEQTKIPERITFSYIGNQIRSIVNLEKGFPFTIWAFLTKPGVSAREYLFGDRKRYFGSIKFLVLTVTIAVFITLKFTYSETAFEEFVDPEAFKDTPQALEAYLAAVNEVFSKYFNALLISAVPIFALFTFIFFRKVKWYYAEHFAIYSYIYGITCLFSILIVPFPKEYMMLSQGLYMSMILIYTTFAFKRIYEEKWWPTIWKTLLIYNISYMILMMIVAGATIIGTIIYTIMNS
ncbi:MAG: DUF3667 domain-containing protein [Saprospiraceae bacterium]